MIVIIDDAMTRHHLIKEWLSFYRGVHKEKVVSVYGYAEAIEILDRCHDVIEHLFLDHDLDAIFHGGGAERTGSDIAKHMVEKDYNIPTTLVTINPAGAEYMERVLRDANIPVERKPIFQFQFELEGVIE